MERQWTAQARFSVTSGFQTLDNASYARDRGPPTRFKGMNENSSGEVDKSEMTEN
jgi:hypothetical protein